MTVLIVDDDPIVLALMQDEFEASGFDHVVVADGGTVAQPLYRRHEQDISLLVCDLHMPDFNGVEFLQFLADRDFRAPIIILSSAVDELINAASVLATAINLNVIATLKKPTAIGEVADIAQKHFFRARVEACAGSSDRRRNRRHHGAIAESQYV